MENRLPSLLHNTFTRYRLTCTVAISLAVHLLVWGAVVWSGVLDPNIILAEKLDQKHQLTLDFIKPRPKPERQNSSPPPQKTKKNPTVFVQVDSKQSSAKKPEDTDKYSNKNSLATNLEPDGQSRPKIEGTQTKVPRTHVIPPPTPTITKLQHQPPIKPAKQPKPKPSPSPPATAQTLSIKLQKPHTTAPKPGLRHLTKPNKSTDLPKPSPIIPPAEHVEPDSVVLEPSPPQPKTTSTLERAKRRLAKAQRPDSQMLPGAAFKQEGGVPRKGTPNFNVVLTGYGDYDNKLITAIYNSWVRKNHEAHMHEPYLVVVEFELLDSGRIEGLNVKRESLILSQTIPEFICKRSIEEPAPFDVWDEKMKQALGTRRSCRITFSFNIRD